MTRLEDIKKLMAPFLKEVERLQDEMGVPLQVRTIPTDILWLIEKLEEAIHILSLIPTDPFEEEVKQDRCREFLGGMK